MAAGDSSGGDFEVGTWKLILFFLLILVLVSTQRAGRATSAMVDLLCSATLNILCTNSVLFACKLEFERAVARRTQHGSL